MFNLINNPPPQRLRHTRWSVRILGAVFTFVGAALVLFAVAQGLEHLSDGQWAQALDNAWVLLSLILVALVLLRRLLTKLMRALVFSLEMRAERMEQARAREREWMQARNADRHKRLKRSTGMSEGLLERLADREGMHEVRR